MRTLIAGSGSFAARLAERFEREKHDVYVIAPGIEKTQIGKDGATYHFSLSDDKLDFVVSSIMPDTIVFLGALDDAHKWDAAQATAMNYLAGLSNLLSSAAANEVSRFVYVSSLDVYGKRRLLTGDQSELNPASLRNLIIQQGEELCAGYAKLFGIELLVLRFDVVYGSGGESDPFAHYFQEECSEAAGDRIFTPIYISDGVDAVYKAADLKTNGGTFEIGGDITTLDTVRRKIAAIKSGATPESTDPADSDAVAPESTDGTDSDAVAPESADDTDSDAVVPGCMADTQTAAAIPELCADTTPFATMFDFRTLVDLDTGLAQLGRFVERLEKREIRAEKRRRRKNGGALRAIVPFAENMVVFALAAAAAYAARQNVYLAGIDFMTLYIIIIAVTFGLFQATLAVLFASSFLLLQNVGAGGSFLALIVNAETVLHILQYFVAGVLCGHSKNRARHMLYEKNLALEDTKNELSTIHEINNANTKIKHILNSRLVNYESSLAKIYAVTDKLNTLQPDKVFFSAVSVVGDIMGCKDVSVYLVTDTGMCRLAARSSGSARTLKKSVRIEDLGELGAAMNHDEIYVNYALDPDNPIMAAPIFADRRLVSIVMLWDTAFEDLTAYHINRLLIVSRLIADSMGKAYAYSRNVSLYQSETGVLCSEAYLEILRVHMDAHQEGEADYHVLEVNLEDQALEDIVVKLKPLLRSTDYVGQDEDGKLYILLTNTTAQDASYVLTRLSKAGVKVYE